MRAQFSDGALTIRAHGAELRVEDGWYSPDYGIRERVPFLRAARRSTPGCDDVVFVLAVER
jgi:hypothetical protein